LRTEARLTGTAAYRTWTPSCRTVLEQGERDAENEPSTRASEYNESRGHLGAATSARNDKRDTRRTVRAPAPRDIAPSSLSDRLCRADDDHGPTIRSLRHAGLARSPAEKADTVPRIDEIFAATPILPGTTGARG
jgi:hypothetical protein